MHGEECADAEMGEKRGVGAQWGWANVGSNGAGVGVVDAKWGGGRYRLGRGCVHGREGVCRVRVCAWWREGVCRLVRERERCKKGGCYKMSNRILDRP